ncbi:AAA family ATPase [Streptomyces salyersiae]|uniref:ATP-binding protein n=1 Tax=Streptomyces salyersiae TaxID=3075530 RepID=A0ABU2RIV5_9ACTN|nr:ATP-binding protein [Streptomyces sp. DSM 41770]MDT0427864.1 ATP-binding protein [Streptomyces sp. DSM 41770]
MAASAEHVRALVEAHAAGDDRGFYSVALQVAAREARQGHTRAAASLRDFIDAARRTRVRRLEPVGSPSSDGELAGILNHSHPEYGLDQMTLDPNVRAHLDRVLSEQRQRGKLADFGFSPVHRMLLTGPPGTGKSMSASAIAHELGLPLYTIRLDGLISRFMGETAAKLRTVFDAVGRTRAVYLFDEFDALGAERIAGNDVGEARRILNSFLLFLDELDSHSLVIAATNHETILDRALFRRFDLVVGYDRPSPSEAVEILRRRLSIMNTSRVPWTEVASGAIGLSHAELVAAAESAAKNAILGGSDVIDSAALDRALADRRAASDA